MLIGLPPVSAAAAPGAKLRIAVALTSLALGVAGCEEGQDVSAIGNAKEGAGLIMPVGCGRCHTVPGIEGATGQVGPSLQDIGRRKIIAGILANTPTNMVKWLKSPQSVVPGNAMPDMGLSDRQASDITAYLYTLR